MNSSRATTASCQGALQVGSIGLHVSAPQACYLKDLSLIYTTELQVRSNVPTPSLYVHIEHGRNTSNVEIPADGLVLTPDGGMHTEAMSGYLDISRSTLRLVVYNQALPNHERQIYLIVLLNKVLFGMGMIRMHASAIQLHGRVAAFTGDRGAGKSSITTRLAMAGGLVLADDDIMLRKQGKQFWVSGCDETMRLLPDAEAYFYQHLSEPTKTFAGIDKKEIRTADRYRSHPYADYPLDHLFFSRVGKLSQSPHWPPATWFFA